jgi:protein-tyrosine kinase
MAVLPIPFPGVSGDVPAVPAAVRKPSRAPRSVPMATPVYTRRELAGLRTLDTVFREMYTIGLPELDAGERLVVGVTSAIRGEGRTTTGLGLALAIARDQDVHVLLIELDFEHPSLARELNLPASPGIAEVLTQEVELDAALRHIEPCSVDVLPAGNVPKAVSRVLRSAALRDFLTAARSSYEVVILDLPPALASSDIMPLSGLTDGVLLVVRAGVTPVRLIERAAARLAEDKLRGVILTGQRSKIPNWIRRLL